MSLDAVGIVCESIEKSIEFYNLFGIEFEQVGGPDHFEGKTPTGLRVMLDSVELAKKLNPDWQKPSGCGVVLCFKRNSATEVDSLHSKAHAKGFSTVKEPWDAFWGQRYCSLKDPDGNQVDLFADLP